MAIRKSLPTVSSRGSAATDDDRDVHRLIRHIRDIDRVRDAELRLLRFIDYVPVRVNAGLTVLGLCLLIVRGKEARK